MTALTSGKFLKYARAAGWDGKPKPVISNEADYLTGKPLSATKRKEDAAWDYLEKKKVKVRLGLVQGTKNTWRFHVNEKAGATWKGKKPGSKVKTPRVTRVKKAVKKPAVTKKKLTGGWDWGDWGDWGFGTKKRKRSKGLYT